MKVLHVPYTFHPDPVGGTEIYVERLAKSQIARGLDPVIVAPGTPGAYEHNGLRVMRFGIGEADLETLYGEGDPVAAGAFARLLEQERPGLVHLHSCTAAVSVLTVRALQQLRVPFLFTYHTPSVSCSRGTLFRWGNVPCDGTVLERRCAACVLQNGGVPRALAYGTASLPRTVGGTLGRLHRSGGAWTALRMRALMAARRDALREFLAAPARIIVPAAWCREVLVRNGVSPERIVLVRHGVSGITPHPRVKPDGTLRVLFLGRLDPVKGATVLLSALALIPDAPIRLTIRGVTQGDREAANARLISASMDSRVALLPPIPPEKLSAEFAAHDVLAVPSLVFETGPLVALEAFAAGVPVIGSRAGGLAEVITHDLNGLLVEPGDEAAWAAALRDLAGNPERLERLQRGVTPPRTMETVADEVGRVYDRLLKGN